MDNGKLSGPPRQLTYLSDMAAHPAFSPDNKWVAFYRIIHGQRDIWTVPATGGNPIQFTNHPASDVHPDWSPDGLQLAFASARTGGFDIWIAPVKDGMRSGPERQLTTGPFSADNPAWSPDGKTVAFRGDSENRIEAWLISTQQESPARQITVGAENIRRIRWDSRDGSSGDLLVSATWGTDRVVLWSVSTLNGARSLFSPRVDFGERDAQVGLFDLSRNGRFLVFSRSGGRKGQIWVLKKAKRAVF
jgi:Tol biopolymer transport system component